MLLSEVGNGFFIFGSAKQWAQYSYTECFMFLETASDVAAGIWASHSVPHAALKWNPISMDF